MDNSASKKYDCVIWGGYARGNTGDELCLAAALQRVQGEFGPKVAVLSPNPEYTAWLFPEVMVVPFRWAGPPPKQRRRRWRDFLKARGELSSKNGQSKSPPATDVEREWKQCLMSAVRLYLAGGGYLNDLWPLDSTLAPLEWAVELNLPVSTAPIGIGTFTSDVVADRVARLLCRAEVKVRDQISHDFCQARGINVTLEPDDAFALLADWQSSFTPKPPGQHPRKIGICVFPQYGADMNGDWSDWWTQCLHGIRRQHPDVELEGFCFHTSLQDEFQEMVRLFRRAGLPPRQVLAPVLDFRQATTAIREYDFIISARFHAVVAANVFQIPNIAIASGDYYSAKMMAAVSGYEDLSTLVNPIDTTPEKMLAICSRGLSR